MARNEFRNRAGLDDAATAKDGDPIAQAFGFGEIVRCQHDASATAYVAADRPPEQPARLDVERVRRFVEHEQIGVAAECEREENALLLSAGKLTETAVCERRYSRALERLARAQRMRIIGRKEFKATLI